MKADELSEQLAKQFERDGITAMAAWPAGRRRDSDGAMVLVSLEGLTCQSAGMQDYLGRRLDEQTAQWKELYGRRAQVTFRLDVLAGTSLGAQECRTVFDQVIHVLSREKPVGLNVLELVRDELEYDGKEGLFRLPCHLKCSGWLYAQGDEAETFLDFTLRGDVNT